MEVDGPLVTAYIDEFTWDRRYAVSDDEGTRGAPDSGADEKGSRNNAISSSGVDLTMIRWFSTLSPLQRLRTVEKYAASINKIRDERHHS